MAYYGILDIAVHLNGFRNIDLLHQGLYRLEVKVYHQQSADNGSDHKRYDPDGNSRLGSSPFLSSLHPDRRKRVSGMPGKTNASNENTHASAFPGICVAAQPYAIIPSRLLNEDSKYWEHDAYAATGKYSDHGAPSLRKKEEDFVANLGIGVRDKESAAGSFRRLLAPSINTEQQCFTSTAFLIRYCDEEVELNDICQFRLELDLCQKDVMISPLFIEFDLLYGDPATFHKEKAYSCTPEGEQHKFIPSGAPTAPHEGSSGDNQKFKGGDLFISRCASSSYHNQQTGTAISAERGDDLQTRVRVPNNLSITTGEPAGTPQRKMLHREKFLHHNSPLLPAETPRASVKFNSVAYQVYRVDNAASGSKSSVSIPCFGQLSFAGHSQPHPVNRCRKEQRNGSASLATSSNANYLLYITTESDLRYAGGVTCNGGKRLQTFVSGVSASGNTPGASRPGTQDKLLSSPTMPEAWPPTRTFTEFLQNGHKALRGYVPVSVAHLNGFTPFDTHLESVDVKSKQAVVSESSAHASSSSIDSPLLGPPTAASQRSPELASSKDEEQKDKEVASKYTSRDKFEHTSRMSPDVSQAASSGSAVDLSLGRKTKTPDAPLPPLSNATETPPLLPPYILRADSLAAEYLVVLISSLVRLQSLFRTFTYRCLTADRRRLVAPALQLHPLQLPGGDIIYLPGTTYPDTLEKRKPGSVTTRSVKNERSSAWIATVAPSLRSACEYVTPRGSGNAFYTEADLLTATFRLSHQAIDEELCRLDQDRRAKDELNNTSIEEDYIENVDTPLPEIYIQASLPRLSARLSSMDQSQVAAIMTQINEAVLMNVMQDFQLIGGQIVALWQQFINLLPLISQEIETCLQNLYHQKVTDYWRTFILRETRSLGDFYKTCDKNVSMEHQKIADRFRQNLHYLPFDQLPVMDMFLSPTPELRPILFEERFRCMASSTQMTHRSAESLLCVSLNPRGVHFIVLVHGFQGNSYDMRLLKNTISAVHPSAVLLCSTANEDNTENCIEVMGEKLAEEIRHFIDEWCPGTALGRLSFVCHSLGGLIARSALQHLTPLWPKFYTFITLSSPHLGYMYSSNRLVEAGMWVLRKWKKSTSLQQLTLSDARPIQDAFLYKLCANSEALGHFQHICLISSYQDQYVPFESARIEMSGRATADPKLGEAYKTMALNTLQHVDPARLIRFDVNFRISERTLDNFIGRAAHIQFLENPVLMQMLFQSYRELLS